MSKKMMKRSLALGALMAFTITGSVWAEETKDYGITNDGTAYKNNNCYISIESNALYEADELTYTGVSTGILAHGNNSSNPRNKNSEVNVHTNKMYIDSTDLGLNTQYNGKIYLGIDTDLKIYADGHGINSGAQYGASIEVDAINADVYIEAGENAVYNHKNGKVDADNKGNEVNIDAKTVTLKSTYTGDDGFKGFAVIAAAKNSTININASGNVQLEGTTGAVKAMNGSVVNVNSNNKVTIKGNVLAEASEDENNVFNSSVKITGETIKIDGAGESFAVKAVNNKWINGKGIAVVNLGDANTKIIEITTTDTGIWANKNNTTVNVNAKDVFITDDTGYEATYAIYAQNAGDYADSDGAENNAKIVFGDNTNLTIDLYKQEDDNKVATGRAIVAMSQGTVNISGNVFVSAEKSILTRGESVITINEDGDSIVQLNGDILFSASASDRIDSDVTVNLDRSESYLNGRIYTSSDNNTDGRVNGMILGLSNGATWNVTGDSFVNELNGSGGNIVFDANAKDVHIDAGTASLNLTMKDKTADDLNDAAGLTTVAKRLGVSKEATKTVTAKVVMVEGDIKGETTGEVTYVAPEDGASDAYYHGEVKEVTEKVNTKNQAISDSGASLKLHWRSYMNDMNKRMGELRNANGEYGVWTRMVRGESEYKNTKAQYNQYQLGYDEKLSINKRWTVGVAVTFADGDASYGQGTTEDKSTAFAIYGSKLNNDGTFVDLIARYAHLESDMEDVNSGKGGYSTNGMSVSAEFGKRIKQGNGLWIEPQVELTYGNFDSAEFKLDSGKAVQLGDLDSLIGRVGFSLGKDIEQGNVYARASYLYDFDGETETTFSNGTDSRTIKDDLGGGWWEVGVGANINLSKATYIYADIEKTFGGEVDTNWQWNLGVRYSF